LPAPASPYSTVRRDRRNSCARIDASVSRGYQLTAISETLLSTPGLAALRSATRQRCFLPKLLSVRLPIPRLKALALVLHAASARGRWQLRPHDERTTAALCAKYAASPACVRGRIGVITPWSASCAQAGMQQADTGAASPDRLARGHTGAPVPPGGRQCGTPGAWLADDDIRRAATSLGRQPVGALVI
jgi:hypothetical protein